MKLEDLLHDDQITVRKLAGVRLEVALSQTPDTPEWKYAQENPDKYVANTIADFMAHTDPKSLEERMELAKSEIRQNSSFLNEGRTSWIR